MSPRDSGEPVLEILLALRHPLAYLALAPARAFVEERGLRVDWLPIDVPSLRPPSEPEPSDDRGVRHRRFRAEAIAREIATYGAAQGLVLEGLYREGDSRAAHIAWLWVRERAPEALPGFLADLFRACWSADLDPSDIEAVSPLVAAGAGNAEDFLEWARGAGAGEASRLADSLRERGINQAPAFVLRTDAEEEVFYGRQHFPMIGWILDGRTGPPPI